MVNPFASSAELFVLRLLRDTEGMYGLQLVQASDGKLKRGSVYVTLGRMEEKGLVRRRVKKAEGYPGMPRPLYSLTAAGKRMLDAWGIVGRGESHP